MPAVPEQHYISPRTTRPYRHGWRASALIVLVTVLLGGCAHHALMRSDDLAAELSSARNDKDYSLAWRIVERVPSSHAQYEEIQGQREALKRDISQHQQGQIQQAEALANSGRWQEAFNTLDTLDRQWPGHDQVLAAQQKLQQRQALRIRQLDSDIQLAEGRWLVGQRSNIDQLGNFADRASAQYQQQLDTRRIQLASQLEQAGHFFGEQKDWPRTRDLLRTAHQLSGSSEKDPVLQEAERQLANAAHRQERAAQQRVRQRAETLLETYQQSGRIEDLVNARDYLTRHNRAGNLDDIGTRLESLSRERFRAGLLQGDGLYAAGRYMEAQKSWQLVAPLYPADPELSKKMDRVERVLQNLRTLSAP